MHVLLASKQLKNWAHINIIQAKAEYIRTLMFLLIKYNFLFFYLPIFKQQHLKQKKQKHWTGTLAYNLDSRTQ